MKAKLKVERVEFEILGMFFQARDISFDSNRVLIKKDIQYRIKKTQENKWEILPINTLSVVGLIKTSLALYDYQGEIIFGESAPCLLQNQVVILDFTGVKIIASDFFHSSVGELYIAFPDTFENLLSAVNLKSKHLERNYIEAIELARQSTLPK